MNNYHRLMIRCPGADPLTGDVFLDGDKLLGVTRVQIHITPDKLVEATLTMYVDFDIDASVVERVFESPPRTER